MKILKRASFISILIVFNCCILNGQGFSSSSFWEKIQQRQFNDISPQLILDTLYTIIRVDVTKADSLILSTKSYFLKNGDPKDLYRLYKGLVDIHSGKIEYADSVLHFAQLSEDASLIGDAYVLKGDVYNQVGRNEEALQFYQEVPKHTKRANTIFNSYLNSAGIFLDISSYDEAKKYMSLAATVMNEADEKIHDTYYSNYGYLYLNTNVLDSAKYHYKKASELSVKFGKTFNSIMYQQNLGIIEMDLGNYELAEAIYKDVLAQSIALEKKNLIMFAYTDLAMLYKQRGEFRKGIDAALKQSELAKELNSIRYQTLASEELSKMYESIGRFDKSLEHIKIARILSDSLTGVRHARKLTEMRVASEFENKILSDSLNLTKTNLALEAEQSRRKNFTWLFVITLLGGLLSLWQYFKAKKAQARSDELLLNILPAHTAHELKTTGATTPRKYKDTSILFADIQNFTTIGKELPTEELVNLLDELFSKFDVIAKKMGRRKNQNNWRCIPRRIWFARW